MKMIIASGKAGRSVETSLAISAELKLARFCGTLGEATTVPCETADTEPEAAVTIMNDPAVTSALALAGMDITGGSDARTIKVLIGHPHPAGNFAINTYVDQDMSPELDAIVSEMISTACFYQERQRMDDSRKGAVKRRLLIGLREVLKACKNGKARAVVVAPNLEKTSTEDSISDVVVEIIRACTTAEPAIPVIFALSRRKLGAALGKSLKASVVAFLSFENLKGLNTKACELAQALRNSFQAKKDGALTPAVLDSSYAAPAPAFKLSASAPEWVPATDPSNAYPNAAAGWG
jgi:ribosomal protein L7Ae-like RNA K-turn-binding protein